MRGVVYCDFNLKILMESPHSSCMYLIISLRGISGGESTHSNPQTPKSNKSDGREDDEKMMVGYHISQNEHTL